ncbi:MAG TPA: tetratricopeptide repeat protein [Candidatus Acidoferrales bacterium]|nr:tetratricopeptide repeat protein [Candidatus Acidoferrales bacterium]
MDTAKAAEGSARNRRQMLEEFVAQHPTDAFGRYGLAMECLKENDAAAAEENFKQLLSATPEYIPAYFQYGRMLATISRTEEARRVLAEGVARASKSGDAHALSEMQAALDDLG